MRRTAVFLVQRNAADLYARSIFGDEPRKLVRLFEPRQFHGLAQLLCRGPLDEPDLFTFSAEVRLEVEVDLAVAGCRVVYLPEPVTGVVRQPDQQPIPAFDELDLGR